MTGYVYNIANQITSRTNISTGEVEEYTFDHRGRLTRVLFKDNVGDPQWGVAYTYDIFNRLVRRGWDSDGDGTGYVNTHYIYDGTQIVLEIQTGSSANLRHRYLWGPAVDQLLADEQVSSISSAGNTIWPLTDHLGTPRDLADRNESTGVVTIVNHRVYNSFGELESETNSSIDLLFGFTARYYDEQTKLQNNWNRWYIASMGQWISEDPIGFGGGDENLRRYVGNHPTYATDPSGLAEGPGLPGASAPRPYGSSSIGDMLYDALDFRSLYYELRGFRKQQIGGEWYWSDGSCPSPIQRWADDQNAIPFNPVPADTIKAAVEGEFDTLAETAAREYIERKLLQGLGKLGKGAKSLGALDDASDASKKAQQLSKALSAQQRKSIGSYQKRIEEHRKKLADYLADPDACDNQGLLKNAPSEEIRKRIIEGRKNHLEKEIKAFQDNIDKILGGNQ